MFAPIIRLLSLAALLTPCLSLSSQAAETTTPTALLVLIIDDMGNSIELGQRAIDLPGAINYAFLPHLHYSKQLAHTAHQQGKEILLHLPMSNLAERPAGAGKLSPIMDKPQFLQTLRDDLHTIPHVSGVNNHMGSLLTQLQQPMNWLMAELKQQNLYFIDSRTSPLTVAALQAQSHQLATTSRDIFLDNQRTSDALSRQFERVILLAKQQGVAVAIAHPHEETLAFLKQALPTLTARGITLSLASTALAANRCSETLNEKKKTPNCLNRIKLAKARIDTTLTK